MKDLEDAALLAVWPSLDEGCVATGREMFRRAGLARMEGAATIALDLDTVEYIARHLAAAGHMLARYDERYGE